MPIYEYSCTKCSFVTEKIVQLNSENEEEFTTIVEPCPKCKNNTFNKIMSSTSFRLEGGGWEKDGYSKKEN